MSKRRLPYLHRRCNGSLSFRIGVPADLREHVGCREFTKALGTPDAGEGVAIALALAGQAKQLFYQLRSDSMKKKRGGRTKRTYYSWEIEIDESGAPKKIRLTDAKPGEEVAIDATISTALSRIAQHRDAAHQSSTRADSNYVPEPESRQIDSVPRFSTVVQRFLDTYPKEKQSGMYRKHKAVLPMLLEIIRDKPVSAIKQANINEFFELLERLPPRWSDECRKRRITI